jgi:hypothetical protein
MLLIAITCLCFAGLTAVEDTRQAIRQEEPQQKPQPVVEPQLAKDSTVPDDEFCRSARSQDEFHPASLRRPASAQVANHVTNEIATDFIPLSYMNAASLQDGGQIVRVQLPRSASRTSAFQ